VVKPLGGEAPFRRIGTGRGHREPDSPDADGDQRADPEQLEADRAASRNGLARMVELDARSEAASCNLSYPDDSVRIRRIARCHHYAIATQVLRAIQGAVRTCDNVDQA